MDYAKINEAAMGYKDDMTKFLRDLVRIPGESCGEKGHIMRIKEEMEKVGFDKVQIDPMGNILGYMGTGKTLIGFDASDYRNSRQARYWPQTGFYHFICE